MRVRFRITVALAAMILAAVAAGQSGKLEQTALVAGSARLGEVKGKVTVHDPKGTDVPATTGLVIVAESTIETAKGSVLLSLQDGSQVLVRPNTRVILKSPDEGRKTFFELLIGKVLAHVLKRFENAPSFKMGTPSAVITVRGTRFQVEVTKKNRTIVDVYEGLVDVAGSGFGGHPVMLRPGFETNVDENQVPTEPHEFDKRERDEDDRRFSPGMVRGPGGSTGRDSHGIDEVYGSRPPQPGAETESHSETEHD